LVDDITNKLNKQGKQRDFKSSFVGVLEEQAQTVKPFHETFERLCQWFDKDGNGHFDMREITCALYVLLRQCTPELERGFHREYDKSQLIYLVPEVNHDQKYKAERLKDEFIRSVSLICSGWKIKSEATEEKDVKKMSVYRSRYLNNTELNNNSQFNIGVSQKSLRDNRTSIKSSLQRTFSRRKTLKSGEEKKISIIELLTKTLSDMCDRINTGTWPELLTYYLFPSLAQIFILPVILIFREVIPHICRAKSAQHTPQTEDESNFDNSCDYEPQWSLKELDVKKEQLKNKDLDDKVKKNIVEEIEEELIKHKTSKEDIAEGQLVERGKDMLKKLKKHYQNGYCQKCEVPRQLQLDRNASKKWNMEDLRKECEHHNLEPKEGGKWLDDLKEHYTKPHLHHQKQSCNSTVWQTMLILLKCLFVLFALLAFYLPVVTFTMWLAQRAQVVRTFSGNSKKLTVVFDIAGVFPFMVVLGTATVAIIALTVTRYSRFYNLDRIRNTSSLLSMTSRITPVFTDVHNNRKPTFMEACQFLYFLDVGSYSRSNLEYLKILADTDSTLYEGNSEKDLEFLHKPYTSVLEECLTLDEVFFTTLFISALYVFLPELYGWMHNLNYNSSTWVEWVWYGNIAHGIFFQLFLTWLWAAFRHFAHVRDSLTDVIKMISPASKPLMPGIHVYLPLNTVDNMNFFIALRDRAKKHDPTAQPIIAMALVMDLVIIAILAFQFLTNLDSVQNSYLIVWAPFLVVVLSFFVFFSIGMVVQVNEVVEKHTMQSLQQARFDVCEEVCLVEEEISQLQLGKKVRHTRQYQRQDERRQDFVKRRQIKEQLKLNKDTSKDDASKKAEEQQPGDEEDKSKSAKLKQLLEKRELLQATVGLIESTASRIRSQDKPIRILGVAANYNLVLYFLSLLATLAITLIFKFFEINLEA